MRHLFGLLCLSFLMLLPAGAQARDGSPARPLEVILIPADGGTEDGTKADFLPLFNAMTRASGVHFRVRVGQSYGAAIEAICTGLADIAWLGPVSYREARDRSCAELLAVESTGGSATYYAGLFALKESGISDPAALKGKSVAFGPPQSASAFVFPVAILMQSGVNPLTDIYELRIGDSHTSGLMALENGLVDAAAASFISFERAADAGALNPARFRVIGRSRPIPNPPLAVAKRLPEETKKKLRKTVSELHELPGVRPEDIRGYGGKMVDRYDISLTDADFDAAFEPVEVIDADFTAAMIRRAGQAK